MTEIIRFLRGALCILLLLIFNCSSSFPEDDFSITAAYILNRLINDSGTTESDNDHPASVSNPTYNNTGAEDTDNWNKKLNSGPSTNDEIRAMAVDSSNNLIVVGYAIGVVSGAEDWWIKKYSSNGADIWTKPFGGIGADVANGVAVDGSDNIYVVGVEGNTNQNWVLRKFSPDGAEDTSSWNITVSNSTQEEPTAVKIDKGREAVYVVGYSDDLVNNFSEHDWWIRKYSLSGALDWERKFNSGGGNQDQLKAAVLDAQGNLYVGGVLKPTIGNKDWWLKKISPDGTEISTGWDNKRIDGNSQDDELLALAVDPNTNELYAAGYGTNLTGSGNEDWWVKKFSADGMEITGGWNKQIAVGNGSGRITGLLVDGLSKVYLVGQGKNIASHVTPVSSLDWAITRFDAGGTEDSSWIKTVNGAANGDDVPFAILRDHSGDIYIGGYGRDLVGGSNLDWWIKKYR